MSPEYKNGNVVARCPDCDGAITTFEYKGSSTGEFGTVIIDKQHKFENKPFQRTLFKLYRCAGCGRGGMAKIHDNGSVFVGLMESFFPVSVESARLPTGIPDGIVKEYREAELCAAQSAWRASSGLLRSTLEKTLKENGYTKGSLASKIDDACSDGIITDARKKKAHDDIRVLGNDVLHDDWREVTQEEVDAAHHYIQRILEDFYDDRVSVVKILTAKGRTKA